MEVLPAGVLVCTSTTLDVTRTGKLSEGRGNEPASYGRGGGVQAPPAVATLHPEGQTELPDILIQTGELPVCMKHTSPRQQGFFLFLTSSSLTMSSLAQRVRARSDSFSCTFLHKVKRKAPGWHHFLHTATKEANVKVPNYLFQFYIFCLNIKLAFNTTQFFLQLEPFKQTGDVTERGYKRVKARHAAVVKWNCLKPLQIRALQLSIKII